MRRLSKVLHISNQKHLILRVPPNQINALKIGQQIVTKNLAKIGRIFDIFGPVNHPYISIQLNPGIEGEDKIGDVLYSFEEKKFQKKRRS